MDDSTAVGSLVDPAVRTRRYASTPPMIPTIRRVKVTTYRHGRYLNTTS
jgi:hypothetical protein